MSLDARKIRLIMQLRRSGITDTRVLAAIERIPRERFVPPAFHDKAYDDTALPIGQGQTISQPYVVARMTEALALTDRHKVLEIGTGSGYQCAVLALLCRRVYTVEVIKALQDGALEILNALRLHNITARVGDGARGWREQAPFDRMIVTAASGAEPPQPLVDQLAVGGIMLIPLRTGPVEQTMVRIGRTETGLTREELWPVRFVPLVTDETAARTQAGVA